MKLVIQIPCYNEAGTLEVALNDLPKHIDGIDIIEYLIINVSILNGSNYPELMIIAAHSGIGPIAYFQELDKLEQNDEIILIIENNKSIYKVKDIWEEKKTGYINFNK